MDPKDKRARVRAWQRQEREAARAELPLDDSEFEALFRMLQAQLAQAPCDHTRHQTEAWLRGRGHDIAMLRSWLDATGGYCDCEVLANSEQAWRWAADRD